MFIPTPAEYYCPADDMHIVLSHKNEVKVYSMNEHAEMTIDGNKVGLDITFAENGITIKTSGAYGLLKGTATAGEKEVKIMEDDKEETYHVRALDCKVVPADFTLFNTGATESFSGHSYLYSYSRK